MTVDSKNADDVEQMLHLFKKYSSLGAAVKADDLPAVKALIDYRKTPASAQGPFSVKELSQVLVLAAGSIKPPMAQLLLDEGAGLIGHKGFDAAFHALDAGNQDLVLHFIDTNFISVNHQGEDSMPLLAFALKAGQFEAADRLAERGVDVDTKMLMMAGGNTCLHLMVADVNFQAVVWLIERGASPCIENTIQKIACEMIPKMDESSSQWDTMALFEGLEDYREAFEENPNRAFEVPMRIREMAHLEHAPMSAQEAMLEAFKNLQTSNQNPNSVIPPQKKKMGF